MMKRILFFLFCWFFLFITPVFSENIITVGVSIPPQKYFVERIGGKKVKVVVLLPAGANPVVYEPKPRQLAMLSKARVFFSIGVPFETPWLSRIKRDFPDLNVVPMYQLINRRPIFKGSDLLKKMQKSGDNNPDPHVWLSPPLVRMMGITIFMTLVNLDLNGGDYFYKCYRKFVEEVDNVDVLIMKMFEKVKRRSFLVFHPSWGYFADAYGLKQVPLEIGGKSPTIKNMGFFIDFAKKNGLKTIFVQPQFSFRFAKRLAELIGGRLEVIDPLSKNWKDNLLKSALMIKRSLE